MEFPNIAFWPAVYLHKGAPYIIAPFSVKHLAKSSNGPGLLALINPTPMPAMTKAATMETIEIRIIFLLSDFLIIFLSILWSVFLLSCLMLSISSLLKAILIMQPDLDLKHPLQLVQDLLLRILRLHSPVVRHPVLAAHKLRILSGSRFLPLCSR